MQIGACFFPLHEPELKGAHDHDNVCGFSILVR